MIKSKDLAKMLGVSTATVSLVLNNKPGISEKTREKVIQGIKDLGYGYILEEKKAEEEELQMSFGAAEGAAANISTSVPPVQLLPASPSTGKNIGFILYRESGDLLGMNSFFPLILDGVEMTARRYGYSLSILNIDKANLAEQVNYIKEANCVGYVIFATELHKTEISFFESLGIPFVIFDNYFIDCEVDSVKVNNEQGTWIGVKHLIEMGHRRIGFLSSGRPINSFKERMACAISAMKEMGAETPEKYVYEIGYPHENAEAGMIRLLDSVAKEDLPTAFMTDNDLVAAGAMRAVQQRGYSVPNDFSFVGYDDRPICTLLFPQLTTIRLPRDVFGAEAVDELIRRMEGVKTGFTKTEINGKLIQRGSVSRR